MVKYLTKFLVYIAFRLVFPRQFSLVEVVNFLHFITCLPRGGEDKREKDRG